MLMTFSSGYTLMIQVSVGNPMPIVYEEGRTCITWPCRHRTFGNIIGAAVWYSCPDLQYHCDLACTLSQLLSWCVSYPSEISCTNSPSCSAAILGSMTLLELFGSYHIRLHCLRGRLLPLLVSYFMTEG